MLDTMEELYRGDEVEVAGGHTRDASLPFESARVLTSLAALKWRTEELILEERYSWNRMACAVRTGEWLLQPSVVDGVRRRNAVLALVLSDMALESSLREAYGRHLCEMKWLPWWLHSRNITVFLEDETPKYSIAFERRMRTARILPFDLTVESDVRSAWTSLVAYWYKAARFGEGKAETQITAEHLRNCEIGLARMFDSKLNALASTAPPIAQTTREAKRRRAATKRRVDPA